MTLAGPQSLHFPERPPGQWPSVSTAEYTSSVKKYYIYVYIIFLFAGNWVGEVTTDAKNVYEWNGDDEEWTVHGTVLERKSSVGVSIVPLSSGVMNYCRT